MPIPREQLQSLIVDTSTEGFLVVDEDGAIRYCNPAACGLFGYSNKELLELKVENLMPRGHRGKHHGLRSDYNQNPQKMPMGKGRNLRALRKDGTSFYVEISLTPLCVDDVRWVIALITDVDVRVKLHLENEKLNDQLKDLLDARTLELSQTQRLYQVVARNYPNGMICVLDHEFNCVFAEGKSIEDLRLTGTEIAGTPYLDHLPDEIRETMSNHLKKALSDGVDSLEVEHDGRWFQIDSVSLDGPNKGQVLVIEQNISEAVKALKKEQEVNEWMSRFVSMASHEFRTPLSTISMSADLSQRHLEKGDADRLPAHLKKIQNNVRHMTGILNDYLDLERLGAQQLEGMDQDFDLVATVRKLIYDAELNSTQLHSFSLNLGPGVIQQSKVFSSEEAVIGIVSNLLSNAIKYSPKGGQTSLILNLGEAGWSLCVKDQGMGISAADLPHITQRFYRADAVQHIPGTGVGLDLVVQFAKVLGGTLQCGSQIGEGSQFTVSWPHVHKPEGSPL